MRRIFLTVLFLVLSVSQALAHPPPIPTEVREDGTNITFTPALVIDCQDNLTCTLNNGVVEMDAAGGAGGGDPVLVNTVAVTDVSGVDLTTGTSVNVTFNAAVTPDTATFDVVDDSIAATELADADFGDFTCADGAGGCLIDADAVALGTDTTNNYVATVADDGTGTVTVVGSGSETAAITLKVVDLSCIDCINATEIEDIYTLNSGDTITGATTINDNNGAGSTLLTIGDATDADSVAIFGDLTVTGGDITLGTTSIFSGGDTASLNNVDAVDATTEATIEAAIDTLGNLTSASALATVGTITSGTWNAGAVTASGKITGNASLDVANGATSSGVLAIFEDSDAGTNKATFQVPSLAADTIYTLPSNDGDASQFLQTDGSGVLSWATATGSGDITSIGNCTSGACFDGTQGTRITFVRAAGNETIEYDPIEDDFKITNDLNIYDVEPHLTFYDETVGEDDFHLYADMSQFYLTRLNSTELLRIDALNMFHWSGAHDFGDTTSVELPNGATPTVDAAGEIAVDTTDNQLVYYGAAKRVIPYEHLAGVVVESLVATDDNFAFFMANDAITVTGVGCNCRGTCSTLATFTLEDRGGNAMTITGTNPTCATTGAATFAAVTAGNALTAGEMIAFDVTNTPVGTTDVYGLYITYTVDAQ